MPFPNDFSHTGYIGGVLARQAFDQEQRQKELEIEEKAVDVKAKQTALAASESLMNAVKEAGPKIAAESDPAKQLEMLGDIASPFSLDVAGELYKKSAASQKDLAAAKIDELSAAITSANASASMLEQIQDGPSLEALYYRTTLQGIDTKGAIPALYDAYIKGGRKWTPELERAVEAGRIAVVSKKDQAEILLQEERVKTEIERQRHYDAQTTKLIPAQVRELEERNSRKLKAGEKGGKLGAQDRVLARSLLLSDWEMDPSVDRPAIDLYVSDTMELAGEMLEETPGLSRQDAVRRAYKTIKEDIFGYPEKEKMVGTRERPAPLPLNDDGKIDPTQMNTTTIYAGVGQFHGQPVKWNGVNAFIPLAGGK